MTIDSKLEMLKRWRANCRRSQIANYDSASRFTIQNYLLGVPTIILSAIVSTSIFATLGKNVDPFAQTIVGMVTVLTAVLVALQTFLKRSELASRHRSIAALYGSVKRQLDQEIAKLLTGEDLRQQMIDTIRERMDALSQEGPVVPDKIWAKARETVPTADQSSGE